MLTAHEISGRVLFEEEQRFPKWLMLLLTGVLSLVLIGMILLVIFIEQEKSEALLGLAIAVPIQLAVIYLFLNSELKLAVTSNGFYYRWKPIHKKFRVIEKEMIEKIEIRRVPVLNYGFGWFPGHGRFYNTHQGPGLQLRLRNSRRLSTSWPSTHA